MGLTLQIGARSEGIALSEEVLNPIHITHITLLLLFAAASPCSAQNEKALTESSEELGNLGDELEAKREGMATYRADPLRPIMDPWNHAWRWVDQELGVNVGFAYTAVYQAATKGSYNGASSGGAGDLDIFGTWDFLKSDNFTGVLNRGTLGFHFEQRNGLDGMPPAELGDTIGSLWGTTSGFNEQPFSLVQWWWQQKVFDEHFGFRVGKIDLASIFDVYRFNSANHFYSNAAFSDNPAIPFPENGFGSVIRWAPNDEWFAIAGFGDAEGRKTATVDTSGNVDAWFSAATVGWNGQVGELGKGLYQLTTWHSDARSRSERPSATGISLVAQQEFGKHWTPYLRYAHSDAAAVDVKHLITAGAVLEGLGRWENDRFGFAAGWGSPHDESLRAQWVTEVFYRMELFPELRITPHAQIIVHPSRNPNDDVLAILGLRARFTF